MDTITLIVQPWWLEWPDPFGGFLARGHGGLRGVIGITHYGALILR